MMDYQSKVIARQELLKKIKQISSQRKEEAAKKMHDVLLEELEKYDNILSFCSTDNEIDTAPLNKVLSKQKRLLLPKVEENSLRLFWVEDVRTQLTLSPWKIMEPNPLLCKEALHKDVDAVIVPGVGFDKANNRIGRGKGFYDRFLANNSFLPSYGIGFKEQNFSGLLPTAQADQKVTFVYLF
jgi:5-formyltetrahydrofolate cyclo-ligase